MLRQAKALLSRLAEKPAYHVLRNTALMVPGLQGLQRRIMTTGAMNEPETMYGWAQQVLTAARDAGVKIDGATVAEVGPGHSLGVAVGILLAGAREVFAVDVKRFADPANLEPLRPVDSYCRAQDLAFQGAPPLEQLMPRLHYAIVSAEGHWPIPDGSMDIVYSYFAGEHLRSPSAVLAETRRVLRPGGLCAYAIDLHDHLHRDSNWLEFLYYEEWLWEAMTSRRGHWSNRLLSPQWRRLFEDGFELLTFGEARKPAPPGFDPARLARPFRSFDVQDLLVGNLWVVARKPA